MKEDFNDWDKSPVIFKDKILNYEYLENNDYLHEVENNYYCLNKDLKLIKEEFYDLKIKELSQELKIENLEVEQKSFIDKMNLYNELKDIGQALIGKIADFKGFTIKEGYEYLEMSEND